MPLTTTRFPAPLWRGGAIRDRFVTMRPTHVVPHDRDLSITTRRSRGQQKGQHDRRKECDAVTKPIKEMARQELIWAIEGYAASARKSFDNGEDPSQTLSRIKSMIEHYGNAADVRQENTAAS